MGQRGMVALYGDGGPVCQTNAALSCRNRFLVSQLFSFVCIRHSLPSCPLHSYKIKKTTSQFQCLSCLPSPLKKGGLGEGEILVNSTNAFLFTLDFFLPQVTLPSLNCVVNISNHPLAIISQEHGPSIDMGSR